MTQINPTPKTTEELRNMTQYERAVYNQAMSTAEPELDYTEYEVLPDDYAGDDSYYCQDFGLITDMPHCENI